MDIKKRALAGATPRYGDAINALKEIAILSGLRVEKVDQTTRTEDVDKMTDNDLQELVDCVRKGEPKSSQTPLQ